MMVAILLVALGVPLWLAAGTVLGALYSRRADGDSTIELAAGEPDELRMLGPFADAAVRPLANR